MRALPIRTLRLMALAALGLCAGLTPLPRAFAGQAVLKGAIVVDGEKVTLGDLFDAGAFSDAPEAARVPVLSSPRPGQSLNLDALALQRFAAAHHITWPNTSALNAVKITRASTVVQPEAIEQTLTAALEARGLEGRFRIRFSGATPTLDVAPGTTPDIAVDRLLFDPTTGQFSASLRAPAGDPTANSVTVMGRAYQITEVPVLARDVKPDETIQARDVIITDQPAEKLGQNVITSPNDIIGTAPRRMLRAGQPIRLGDVQPPILVKKGALVTMTLRMPGMTLTAEGRAVEDGAHGESIKVINTHSKRTVVATVEGEGLVSVGPAAPPALAVNLPPARN